jgi:LysM repeat protein
VSLGLLVPVKPGRHFELAQVSYPYARPVVRTFIDRLSSQYFAACHERLVVTSLTRPTGRQPRNASDQSVHPAGMAVDLRISKIAKCRNWLEHTLLALEKQGVLDATRERRPAHYHIAVFPQPYLTYVARLDSRGATRLATNVQPGSAPTRVADATPGTASGNAPAVAAAGQTGASDAQAKAAAYDSVAQSSAAANTRPETGATAEREPPATPPVAGQSTSGSDTKQAQSETTTANPGASARAVQAQEENTPTTIDYRVHRGDTLWSIARRHGTSVRELKALNNLSGTRIAAGQVIIVPAPGQP